MSLFDLRLPDHVERDIHSIAQSLRDIVGEAREFVSLFRLFVVRTPVSEVHISQVSGGKMGVITGVPVGGTGHFVATPIPANGQFQAGSVPRWSTGDPSVTLTPSTDGLSVDANVSATETLPSFGLTFDGVSSNGNAINKTVTVPILAAAPVPATDVDITQTS
jgi:hypothetical protein